MMYRLKKTEIFGSEIAEYLELDLRGRDFLIRSPSSFRNVVPNSIVYMDASISLKSLDICQHKDVLFLIPDVLNLDPGVFSFLVSKNPKLDFLRVTSEFFSETENYRIASTSRISPAAVLHRNISIGENVFIGPDVIIGESTEILNNVVIHGIVTIGEGCIIKDNSTIGSVGYNFEPDEAGLPIHYPSIGRIIIGNHVFIGSNTTIESPSLDNTTIEDHVKIDDLVHIGYNSHISAKSLITAGVVVSRNVTIGTGCILAPNSSIKENVIIGHNVVVGTGSVVISNLEDNKVYVGNPARYLRTR